MTPGSVEHPELVTMGETMALLSHLHTTPLRHAQSLQLGIGGSESNVAIAAARLGIGAAWIGRVGADEFGHMVLRELRAEGIRTLAAVDASRPTGVMVKARRTSQTMHVTYYRAGSAGSALDASEIVHEVLENADVFHTSAITPALSPSAADAVFRSIEVCRASGTFVSVDLNYRRALHDPASVRKQFRRLACMADLVFATVEEARLACDATEAHELARELAALGGGRAVVKRGELGAVAFIDGRSYTVQAVPVNAVDSVGAGDAFAGGYLAGMIQGLDTDSALHQAALMGAWAVSTHGDWQGLPSRSELESLESLGDDVHR